MEVDMIVAISVMCGYIVGFICGIAVGYLIWVWRDKK